MSQTKPAVDLQVVEHMAARLSPEAAARLVVPVARRAVEMEEPWRFEAALALVVSLAKASRSARLPGPLEALWPSLAARASGRDASSGRCLSLLADLGYWYRRDGIRPRTPVFPR